MLEGGGGEGGYELEGIQVATLLYVINVDVYYLFYYYNYIRVVNDIGFGIMAKFSMNQVYEK